MCRNPDSRDGEWEQGVCARNPELHLHASNSYVQDGRINRLPLSIIEELGLKTVPILEENSDLPRIPEYFASRE
ncbi:MAG: hypothetical protein HC880_12130 [Bacteroidia bacterium]|nr:hypothetical protein [Bacteroidia bacterium]